MSIGKDILSHKRKCLSKPHFLTRLSIRADQENKKAIMKMIDELVKKHNTKLNVLEVGPGEDPVISKLNFRGHLCGLEFPGHGFTAEKSGLKMYYCDLSINAPWPFEDGDFDLIVSNQVLEHLPNTDHFFRELYRVLKLGGYAIVSTPNLASWDSIISLFLGFQPRFCNVSDELLGVGNPLSPQRSKKRQNPTHAHLRIFTIRALAEMMRAYGFRVEKTSCGSWMGIPIISLFLTRLDPLHGTWATVKARKV